MKNLLETMTVHFANRNRAAHSVSRRGRVAVASVMVSLMAVAFLASRIGQQRAPADTVALAIDRELAIQSFTNAVAINLARQRNPELVKQDALVAFSILNPELALRERRKDPALVEADQMAAFTLLNARLIEAELEKDPEFRQRRAEAFQTLGEQPSP